MKTLSISTAWNETAAFVKREGSLLFPIAFALIALPGILFQAIAPAPVPGQQVEPGVWPLLFFVPMLLVTLLGTLTLTIMALHPGTVVKDAIAAAARRLLSVLGAIFLFGLGVALIAIPVTIAAGLSQAGGSKALVAVLLLATVPAIFYVCVRLLLVNPVGANEAVRPVAMLRRSWALTAGHFWKLAGFLIVVAIVVFVIAIAISSIAGILVVLAAGQPDPGSLPAVLLLVISGLLNAVVTVYMTACVARIYAQLSDTTLSDVFA